MCQIWLQSDGRVEKGGYRQTDKGTLQLYSRYYDVKLSVIDVVSTCVVECHIRDCSPLRRPVRPRPSGQSSLGGETSRGQSVRSSLGTF